MRKCYIGVPVYLFILCGGGGGGVYVVVFVQPILACMEI